MARRRTLSLVLAILMLLQLFSLGAAGTASEDGWINFALGQPVTLVPEEEPDRIPHATDGIVPAENPNNYVNASGTEGNSLAYIQVDMGEEQTIESVVMWHYGSTRVYHDIILQFSNDPAFVTGVTTVFNNDSDNSAGLGAGSDEEYTENTESGKTFTFAPVTARYFRTYANGFHVVSNPSVTHYNNHWQEVQLWGRETPVELTNIALGVVPSISPNCKSEDEYRIPHATDGIRPIDAGGADNYVTTHDIDVGPTALTLDFGAVHEISEVVMWHYAVGNNRTYHDVIIQFSNDPTFTTGVTTVFNNDADNSAGQGAGADEEYLENADTGKTVTFAPVQARYFRTFVYGFFTSTATRVVGHWQEIEVYGVPTGAVPPAEPKVAASNGYVAVDLGEKPEVAPVASDFSVSMSIDAGPLSPPFTIHNFTYNCDKLVEFEIDSLVPSELPRTVTIVVTYKGAVLPAATFTVEAKEDPVDPPDPPTDGAPIYEPFDYAIGAGLSAMNGGAGLKGSWHYRLGAAEVSIVDGLSYEGIDSTGNAVQVKAQNDVTYIDRAVDSAAGVNAGDAAWYSFLVNFKEVNPQVVFELMSNGVVQSSFGKDWYWEGNFNYPFSMYGYMGKTVIQSNKTYLLVARISDGRLASLWVNPDLSAEPTEQTAEFYNVTLHNDTTVGLLSTLTLYALTYKEEKGTIVFDELRAGSTWEQVTGQTYVPAAPSAPSGLTASNMDYADRVALQWAESSGRPESYEVYRSAVNNSAQADKIATVTAKNYTDAAVAPESVYYYWVKAVNSVGASDFSAVATGKTSILNARTGDISLSAPVAAIADNGKTLTWGSVANAEGYQVYRNSTLSLKTASRVANSVTGLSFTDESGSGHDYYWVRAIAAGSQSLFSAAVVKRDPDAPLTVMTIGDSITMGGQTYRDVLKTQLAAQGVDIAYVGRFHDGKYSHQGMNGAVTGPGESWTPTAGYANNLYDQVEDFMQLDPDMALIMIGINDFSNYMGSDAGKNNDGKAHERLEAVVRKMLAVRPDMTIALSSVLDVSDAKHATYPKSGIENYNANVAQVASKLNAEGYKVYFADLYNRAGLDPNNTSDLHDGLHPAEAGNVKLGSAWFEAVTAILNPPEPTNIALGVMPKLAPNCKTEDEYRIPHATDGILPNDDNDNYTTTIDQEVGPTALTLDFGAVYEISEVVMWHYAVGNNRTYHDVIIQFSNDPTFTTGVTTVYNNDADNSAGQGAGTDEEYVENINTGKTVTFTPVKARYFRTFVYGYTSTSGTSRPFGHWQEIEVYGIPSAAGPLALEKAVVKNGSAVLTFNKALDTRPSSSDFALQYRINGGEPQALSITGLYYDEGACTVSLVYPKLNAAAADQTVDVTIVYKGVTLETVQFVVKAKADLTAGLSVAVPETVPAGQAFNVSVNLTDNPGLTEFVLALTYDADNFALASQDVSVGTILADGTLIHNLGDLEREAGVLLFGYEGIRDFAENGTLFTVTLKAGKEVRGDFAFALQALSLTSTGQDGDEILPVMARLTGAHTHVLPPETLHAALTVGSATNAKAGDIVSIPITIDGNPGIAEYALRMAFDESKLAPVAIVPGSLFNEDVLLGDNLADPKRVPGGLAFNMMSFENIIGNGDLFTVQFKVLSGEGAPFALDLSCSSMMHIVGDYEDFAGVQTAITNGSVSVSEQPVPTAVITHNTPSIVSTYAANILVLAESAHIPAGATLMAMMEKDGMIYTQLALVDGRAMLRLEKADANIPAGIYNIVITLDGVVLARSDIEVRPNNEDYWNVKVSADENGKTRLEFAETLSSSNGSGADAFNGYVTVNGVKSYQTKVDDNVIILENVDFVDAMGATIVVSTVKYPLSFPSYKFTFTITVPVEEGFRF